MSNGKGSRPRNNMSEAFRANFDHIFRKAQPIQTVDLAVGKLPDTWTVRTYEEDKKTWPKDYRPKIAAYTVVFKPMPNQAPANPSKPRKRQGNGPSGAPGKQGKGHK